MNISEKNQIIISWLIIAIFLWLGIGALLFPNWWHYFFLSGGLLSAKYWGDGFRIIFHYLFFEDRSLLAFLFLLFLYFSMAPRFNLPTLPRLNLLKPKGIFSVTACGIIIALLIYSIPDQKNYPYNSSLEKTVKIETNISEKFKAPIDFLFLDETRINNLYSQIAPKLAIKESSIEENREFNKGLEGGAGDLIKGNTSTSTGEKKIEQYAAKEITPPEKAISLLNYFSGKKSLEEFQTLELSSDEIKQLENFNIVSQSYGIKYDKSRYDSIYTDIIKKTIIEQQEKLKNLKSQLVIYGTFNINLIDNKILLSHDYFNKNEIKIVFYLDPIPDDSPSIKAASLKNKYFHGKNIEINAFGRVMRIESKDIELKIYCEAYAIW